MLTMLAPCAFCKAGITAWQVLKTPFRLISRTSFHSCSLIRWKGPTRTTPAEFTTISMWPFRLATSCAMFRNSVALRTSTSKEQTLSAFPEDLNLSVPRCKTVPSRSSIATVQPCSKRVSAMHWPMPDAAPVISATLLLKPFIVMYPKFVSFVWNQSVNHVETGALASPQKRDDLHLGHGSETLRPPARA